MAMVAQPFVGAVLLVEQEGRPHTSEKVRQARREPHLIGWVPTGGDSTEGKLLLSTAHRIMAINRLKHTT